MKKVTIFAIATAVILTGCVGRIDSLTTYNQIMASRSALLVPQGSNTMSGVVSEMDGGGTFTPSVTRDGEIPISRIEEE